MTEKDDAAKLGEISQQLTAIDVDDASAERIVMRTRLDVGRGPSPRRFIEPILVALFASSFLIWALYKVLEVYR